MKPNLDNLLWPAMGCKLLPTPTTPCCQQLTAKDLKPWPIVRKTPIGSSSPSSTKAEPCVSTFQEIVLRTPTNSQSLALVQWSPFFHRISRDDRRTLKRQLGDALLSALRRISKGKRARTANFVPPLTGKSSLVFRHMEPNAKE